MANDYGSHSQISSSRMWLLALKEAGIAFCVAAVLLVIFYSAAFRWIHPEFVPFMDRNATTLVVPGNNFVPISVGKRHTDSSSMIIADFNRDEAILLVPRAFEAEDYPFIKVRLTGFSRFSKFKILWRRVEDPSKTHALEFNRDGDGATQIAMVYGNKAYRGRIADIALLFYDGPALGFENNNDVDIVIQSIELRPFSAGRVAEQIFEDWTNPPLWQGYSNNIVRGIHANGMVFPNTVANLMVAAGLITAALIRWIKKLRFTSLPQHRLLAIALCLCLYGWVFNDVLRWHWRIEQLIDTHERYGGLPLEERIRNSEIRCTMFPNDCGAHLLPYF